MTHQVKLGILIFLMLRKRAEWSVCMVVWGDRERQISFSSLC